MSPTIPTVYTEHLALRPFREDDVTPLHRIYQTEGVLKYFPNPIPPPFDKVAHFIASQQSHWERYGYGNWALTELGCDEIIGWAGLQFLPETQETEVGYLLNKPYWGKGYATEAARRSLDFGFSHFDFPEIIALVHPQNLASLAVARKCALTIVERKVYWGIKMVRHSIQPPLNKAN